MTAGTVLGLFLLKVMDSRKVLILFTSIVLVCLALALFGSANVSRISFQAIGFFIAVMWPIIFSLALNSIEEHHGSISFESTASTGTTFTITLPLNNS